MDPNQSFRPSDIALFSVKPRASSLSKLSSISALVPSTSVNPGMKIRAYYKGSKVLNELTKDYFIDFSKFVFVSLYKLCVTERKVPYNHKEIFCF